MPGPLGGPPAGILSRHFWKAEASAGEGAGNAPEPPAGSGRGTPWPAMQSLKASMVRPPAEPGGAVAAGAPAGRAAGEVGAAPPPPDPPPQGVASTVARARSAATGKARGRAPMKSFIGWFPTLPEPLRAARRASPRFRTISDVDFYKLS